MKLYPKSKVVNPLFTGLLLILLFTYFWKGISIAIFLVPLVCLAWLVIIIMGSGYVHWNYHYDSLNHNHGCKDNQIALTFDDGPHPERTPIVLELLKKFNIQATFFCIGREMAAHPELVKRIVTEGHTIGNHTYNHSKNFGFYRPDRVVEELQQTDQIAAQIVQKKLRLFRPPFGVTNPSIKKALLQSQHTSIGWSIRSLDTKENDKNKLFERVTIDLKKGDIILLHDTMPITVEILEDLLIYLRKNNFEAVTVNKLLNIEAYEKE